MTEFTTKRGIEGRRKGKVSTGRGGQHGASTVERTDEGKRKKKRA